MNNFVFLNVQGLCPQTVPSKVPFVNSTLCGSNNLFVALSETWLKNHTEAELNIKGYTLFRCDTIRKKKKRGRHTGGVGIYVRQDIACSCEILFSHSSECVQMLCLYSSVEDLVIMAIYRQPDDSYNGHPSTDIDFNIPLMRAKNAILSLNPTPDIIMGGDFNIPHATWPEGSPSNGATNCERSILNSLNEFSNELFLCQYVTKPTHKDGNILDLVFVNNPSLIHCCTVIPVLQSTSHHSIVEVSTSYLVKNTNATLEAQQTPKTGFHSLNFFSERIDWDGLNQEFESLDWKDLFEECDVDSMLEIFYTNTFKICKRFIPTRKKITPLKK